MKYPATKIEVLIIGQEKPEASVAVGCVQTPEDIISSVETLLQVVELAFQHHDTPVELTYVAKTDIQIL